ncbi:LuxR family transcriptional regulator [Krasilnikovia sp. MM14-A1004]
MAEDVTAALPGPDETVVVTGEPGVGKSHLLRRAGRRWPGAAFATSGTAASAGEPLAAAGALLPGWLPADAGPAATEAGARRIRELAGARPVLLVVDNAEHLDEQSALLVRRILPPGAGLLLACTADHEPPAHLTAGRPVRRHTVAALDREPAHRLAAALLGGPVDGLSAYRMWHSSGGNPRLLTHLVEQGRADGALVERDGVWRWAGPPPSAPGLRDLLLAVTGQPPPGELAALEYLACAQGAPLRVLSPLVAADAVARLRRRGLVDLGPDDTVRLSRPLYAQAVRAPQGRLRRRRIHQQLVAAAAARPEVSPVLTAQWRMAAGMSVPAAELRRAARRALADGDAPAAERLARSAGDAALLGRALVAQDRPAEAEEALRHTACHDLRRLNRLWGLRQAGAVPSGGIAGRAAALFVPEPTTPIPAARLVPDPTTRVAAADFAGSSAAAAEDLAGVEAAAAVEQPDDPVLVAAAAALEAFGRTFAGAPERVVREHRGLPRLWPSMRGSAAACHVHALLLTGRLAQARERARAYYDAALTGGEPGEVTPLALARGVCEWWAGSPARALPWLREAVTLLDARIPFPIEAYVRSEYAVCLAASGDGAEASRLVAGLRAALPAGPGLDGQLRMTELQVTALTGRYAHAADLATALAVDMRAAGRLTEAVEALHLACRLRPSRAVAADLADVVAACDSPFFPLLARHAAALADRDTGELRRCAAEFAELGYLGLGAEAYAPVDPARADELVARCDGYRPPWTAATAADAALTGREREVCELAAAGLPNTEISHRLGISVRTVGNHLQRAYEKLHVGGRRELGEVLGLS